VLSDSQLPQGPVAVLGRTHGARITTMVTDMIESSAQAEEIVMSQRVWDAMMELRAFLFDNVYLSDRAKAEEPRAYRVVQMIFEHYLAHPDELPEEFVSLSNTTALQRVVDYVAGMTDRFAIREFERLFVPRKWMV
jgi:dGTPase